MVKLPSLFAIHDQLLKIANFGKNSYYECLLKLTRSIYDRELFEIGIMKVRLSKSSFHD